MRLDIMNLCARSPTMLATITLIRQAPSVSCLKSCLNLTTLAPDIAAILDDTLPHTVTLFELAAGTPLLWEQQRGRVDTAN